MQRKMIEQTIINLTYDMDCIGIDNEICSTLSTLSDDDLISVLNQILESI